MPNTQAFIELIQEKVAEGNNIELIQKQQNIFIHIQKIYLHYYQLNAFVFILLVFKMQGLGDKGKVYDAETTKSKIKFDDVAGLDEEKQ